MNVVPPRLPVLSYRKVKQILNAHGFQQVGQRGSHVYFQDGTGRRVTVPNHAGQDIGRGLLLRILEDAGIPPDQVRK